MPSKPSCSGVTARRQRSPWHAAILPVTPDTARDAVEPRRRRQAASAVPYCSTKAATASAISCTAIAASSRPGDPGQHLDAARPQHPARCTPEKRSTSHTVTITAMIAERRSPRSRPPRRPAGRTASSPRSRPVRPAAACRAAPARRSRWPAAFGSSVLPVSSSSATSTSSRPPRPAARAGRCADSPASSGRRPRTPRSRRAPARPPATPRGRAPGRAAPPVSARKIGTMPGGSTITSRVTKTSPNSLRSTPYHHAGPHGRHAATRRPGSAVTPASRHRPRPRSARTPPARS